MKDFLTVASLPIAIALVLIGFIIYFTYNDESNVIEPQVTATKSEEKPVKTIYELTNEHRVKMGLGTLAISNYLKDSSAVKAADMCVTDHFEHSLSNGSSWEQPIIDTGYTYTKAGENLAKGYETEEKAFTALLDSPTHRTNIEDPAYTETGITVEECGGKNYIAIHYGKR